MKAPLLEDLTIMTSLPLKPFLSSGNKTTFKEKLNLLKHFQHFKTTLSGITLPEKIYIPVLL